MLVLELRLVVVIEARVMKLMRMAMEMKSVVMVAFSDLLLPPMFA